MKLHLPGAAKVTGRVVQLLTGHHCNPWNFWRLKKKQPRTQWLWNLPVSSKCNGGLGPGQVYSLDLTACRDWPDVIRLVGKVFRWLKQSCSLLEAGINLLLKKSLLFESSLLLIKGGFYCHHCIIQKFHPQTFPYKCMNLYNRSFFFS